MTARIFAILAAGFLVLAVGIVALTPMGLTLAQGLLMIDKTVPDWLRAHSESWVWTWLELPLLLRPLWLLPTSLAVVFAGLAASFNLGRTAPSRRRG